MHNAVVNVYGEWNFAGLYAGGKSGTAENGGGKAANAVFAGFLQDSDYPLAFIVVVEEGGGGASVCTPILSQVPVSYTHLIRRSSSGGPSAV